MSHAVLSQMRKDSASVKLSKKFTSLILRLPSVLKFILSVLLLYCSLGYYTANLFNCTLMKTSQSHDSDKMQFRLLGKIKTTCWSFNRSATRFLQMTVESRDLPPPKLLMLLCFMVVSSRETPACLAAPEVCTKCPTGAPHQAQGTSAHFHLLSLNCFP